MRIKKIDIMQWRNFNGVSIEISPDVPLLCLVGANGTGKSHILELIAAAAHRVGLSSGVALPRGNPFEDEQRDFQVEFLLSGGVSSSMDNLSRSDARYARWDRSISVRGTDGTMLAGGMVDEATARDFATKVAQTLRESKEIHHLRLDADRAFPKRNFPVNELAQVFDNPWFDENWTKGRAFQTTSTLYEEWIKYCLAKENSAASLYYRGARRAADGQADAPKFSDAFETYRNSLRQVMPHLLFAGAEQKQKTILFDTAGLELRFDQLSGGEREIAFLVGQIDRFGLRNGIFLLDEPELHLNPDLVRSWVTYLASTVSTGQTWLATHSLEAVEAAGVSATILLERNFESKRVESATSLKDKPVLSALSRAVGTPAFSIDGIRFVFVEGEEAIGERERFRRITGLSTDTRFIECRSCTEVIQRLASLRSIASETAERIRVVGVVDRDWRTSAEVTSLENDHGVVALQVHEVENFFLHEDTLMWIAKSIGNSNFDYQTYLRSACDARAGGWIVQSALSSGKYAEISKVGATARQMAHGLTWSTIESDIPSAMQSVTNASGLSPDLRRKLQVRLVATAKIYERLRLSCDLWKRCEGKEISKVLAMRLGFGDFIALERAILNGWENHKELLPAEVKALRRRLEKT